jgi:Glycosyltransferase family 87
MPVWKWFNAKRLRDYPRLIFIASWAVLLLNVVFQHGWIGGLTGILIGGDFISNYSGGVIYKTDIRSLYNSDIQQTIQAALISPYKSPGFAPFISPPYVALMMSWIASISLPYAFVIWEIVNLICAGISVYMMTKYLLPENIRSKNLPSYQLLIIIFSTFAFVDGFLSGQSHGIILLLCTGILVAMMKEKWFLAGFLGSLLTYKPQFVVGFLICWILWVRIKALLSFGFLTALWQIPILLTHGLTPYLDYLQFTKSLLYLPYAKDGFPISVMATPYAFIATLLPIEYSKILQGLYELFDIVILCAFIYMVYRSRNLPKDQRYVTYSMAIILPLVIAPHTLIYDLLILVPALVLLANIKELTNNIKWLSISFYIGFLFLPLVGYVMKLALPGLIPLALLFFVLRYYFRPKITAELSS